MDLNEHGAATFDTALPPDLLDRLRRATFSGDSPGERCLLDHPEVQTAALILKEKLTAGGHLAPNAIAIQAIAFDKTAGTNWKVSWHQDLMFPFISPVSSPGFDLPCVKQGVSYARPPADILQRLLAVRLHLDDCGPTNGPLRLSPGSHQDGILNSTNIPETVARHGEVAAIAKTGEALLMRPLLLHASSKATSPHHRRVLHFVYDTGEAMTESWHRAI